MGNLLDFFSRMVENARTDADILKKDVSDYYFLIFVQFCTKLTEFLNKRWIEPLDPPLE